VCRVAFWLARVSAAIGETDKPNTLLPLPGQAIHDGRSAVDCRISAINEGPHPESQGKDKTAQPHHACDHFCGAGHHALAAARAVAPVVLRYAISPRQPPEPTGSVPMLRSANQLARATATPDQAAQALKMGQIKSAKRILRTSAPAGQ